MCVCARVYKCYANSCYVYCLGMYRCNHHRPLSHPILAARRLQQSIVKLQKKKNQSVGDGQSNIQQDSCQWIVFHLLSWLLEYQAPSASWWKTFFCCCWGNTQSTTQKKPLLHPYKVSPASITLRFFFLEHIILSFSSKSGNFSRCFRRSFSQRF